MACGGVGGKIIEKMLENADVELGVDYLKDKETNWYDIPENVVGVVVDPITGNLATDESEHKKILYYIKGTEPSYTQEVFDEYEEKKEEITE